MNIELVNKLEEVKSLLSKYSTSPKSVEVETVIIPKQEEEVKPKKERKKRTPKEPKPIEPKEEPTDSTSEGEGDLAYWEDMVKTCTIRLEKGGLDAELEQEIKDDLMTAEIMVESLKN